MFRIVFREYSCWFRNSAPTVQNLVNNGLNYQSQVVKAGFFPSTVWNIYIIYIYIWMNLWFSCRSIFHIVEDTGQDLCSEIWELLNRFT